MDIPSMRRDETSLPPIDQPTHLMKKLHTLILAGLCAIGLLAGFSARRISWGNSSAGHAAAAAPARSQTTDHAHRPKPILPEIPLQRSTETVESILTADPATSYARIALWLATASEQDLAAYWASYKDGKRTVDVTDLIFLNWTRRNPQAAIAAVAGTGDERYAWWAWAASDPQSALSAAKAAGKDQLTQVAAGIGDFNPAWLRAHLDQIPEEFQGEAFNRMKNWPTGQDPLASLKFLKENGIGIDAGIFKNLVREDPWAALDWLTENPQAKSDPFGDDGSSMNLLVSTMAEEHPEDLERLASQTPAGDSKRKMEQALFDQLLENDPEAALVQARAIEAPLVAAQRLGQIGLGLLATDPEKAFELAAEILASNPHSLNLENRIEYKNGSMTNYVGRNASQLVDALFAKDREKTLTLMSGENDGDTGIPGMLFEYSGKWADDDLAGFTNWANQQTGRLHQVAAQQIGNLLAAQGQFLESIEWAKAGTHGPDVAYNAVLHYWHRADPDAAFAWLENSDLTVEQKATYAASLKKRPQ